MDLSYCPIIVYNNIHHLIFGTLPRGAAPFPRRAPQAVLGTLPSLQWVLGGVLAFASPPKRTLAAEQLQ